MLADRIKEPSTLTLDRVVREVLQLELAELGVKELKELLSNVPIQECLCLNSGSALSCVTLRKL